MTRQLAAGLLCFLYASGAAAQTGSPVTDVARLEGTWTLDIERSGVTESERRVVTLGPTWIRVTIHRAMDDHPPVLIYNLDGSKGLNPFGDGTATTALYREPTGLRTETVYTIHDRPTTVSEVFRLNAAGGADDVLDDQAGLNAEIDGLARARRRADAESAADEKLAALKRRMGK